MPLPKAFHRNAHAHADEGNTEKTNGTLREYTAMEDNKSADIIKSVVAQSIGQRELTWLT